MVASVALRTLRGKPIHAVPSPEVNSKRSGFQPVLILTQATTFIENLSTLQMFEANHRRNADKICYF